MITQRQTSAINRAVPVMRAALHDIRHQFRSGITERQLDIWLRRFLRTRGYDRFAFDPIIAFGPSAAEPHHIPGSRRLKKGQMIKIDFGMRVAGTATDVTRTFFYGKPTTLFRTRYRAVLQAQRYAIGLVKPGVAVADIDTVAREYLAQQGMGDRFIHGTGHGIGYRIHQHPFISPRRARGRLQPGQLITIEPGVYYKKWGGIRIEDMVLVTKKGHIVLTKSIPK